VNIRLTTDGTVVLDAAEDFRHFAVLVPAGTVPAETALATLMQLEGGSHAWVPPAAVLALHPTADADWRERFNAMVAYAANKGWTDPQGRICAHIEDS